MLQGKEGQGSKKRPSKEGALGLALEDFGVRSRWKLDLHLLLWRSEGTHGSSWSLT